MWTKTNATKMMPVIAMTCLSANVDGTLGRTLLGGRVACWVMLHRNPRHGGVPRRGGTTLQDLNVGTGRERSTVGHERLM